jgi:hypothetical protein
MPRVTDRAATAVPSQAELRRADRLGVLSAAVAAARRFHGKKAMTDINVSTPTAQEQLTAKVRRLATLRDNAAEVDLAIAGIERRMHEQNAQLYALEKRLMEEVKQLDLEIRGSALDLFLETGDKHPAAGLEVKIGTDVVYDRAKADAWSIEHNMARVPAMLDAKVFEKLVKSEAIKLDFVTLENKPAVTIARDLNKALADAHPELQRAS